MPRDPIPTHFFVIVVVRKGDRFLLIQERNHHNQWYIPAGRVEPGETFFQAAYRETLEESGIPIRITGLIRIEHSSSLRGTRMRVVFVAEPVDDTRPKQVADEHSLVAIWVSLDQLSQLPLRGTDVREVFEYVANGGTIYPEWLIQLEDAPY